MFGASVVVGLTIVGIAVWLEWRESQGDVDGLGGGALDQRYLGKRRWLRRAIHLLLLISGVIVLVAGFAGPGRVWVFGWLAVAGLLVMVLALAVVDLWRTKRYLRRKLPELRRQTLGDDVADD